jgi:hypothetical protein
MNKLLKAFLVAIVALSIIAQPTVSDSSFGPQLAAAQGGGGGGIKPPFPFGMSVNGKLVTAPRRNRPNFFAEEADIPSGGNVSKRKP